MMSFIFSITFNKVTQNNLQIGNCRKLEGNFKGMMIRLTKILQEGTIKKLMLQGKLVR